MKKLKFAGANVAAAAVAGAVVGLAATSTAPAWAAPSGAGTALDTVTSLKSDGYKVVVNKVGAAPMELCTVDTVRPGRTTDLRVDNVVLQPVYLTANCW
jgi:hypothetical protein